jgi:hypothetical protein
MTRLRDLARYGMLYTPSWSKAARERIISDGYLRRIQTGGRKGMFLKGELSNRLVNKYRRLIPGNGMRYSLMAIFYKAGSCSQASTSRRTTSSSPGSGRSFTTI